jgi:hypothetical protein
LAVLEKTGLQKWTARQFEHTYPRRLRTDLSLFRHFLKEFHRFIIPLVTEMVHSPNRVKTCEIFATYLSNCYQKSSSSLCTTKEWNYIVGEVMSDVDEVFEDPFGEVTGDCSTYLVSEEAVESKNNLPMIWNDLEMKIILEQMFDEFRNRFGKKEIPYVEELV